MVQTLRHIYGCLACSLGLLLMTQAVSAQTDIRWEAIVPVQEGGGVVYEMQTVPDGDVYVLARGFRVNDTWRSGDQGESWSHFRGPVYTLVAAPDGNGVLLGKEGGLFRSTDGGETSVPLSKDLEDYVVGDVVFRSDADWIARAWDIGEDPELDGTGAVFFQTHDAGLTWEEVGGLRDGVQVNELVVCQDGTLLCSAIYPVPIFAEPTDSSGIISSTDGGATWNLTSLTEKYMLIRTITVGDNGTILAGAQLYQGTGRVYRSTDNGRSWSTTTLQDISSDIVQAPDGTWYATAANSGVYMSTDDGKNWSRINAGLIDVRVFPLVLHPGGRLFCADVFGNFYRTMKPVVAPAQVKDVQRSLAFSIVPNPVAEEARIHLAGVEKGDATITLVDGLGRILSTATRRYDGDALVISCADLSAGMYTVRVQCHDAQGTLPLVVVR